MDTDSATPSRAPSVSDMPVDSEDDEQTDGLGFEMDEDPVERIPGESLLPSGRLENIIKVRLGVRVLLGLACIGLAGPDTMPCSPPTRGASGPCVFSCVVAPTPPLALTSLIDLERWIDLNMILAGLASIPLRACALSPAREAFVGVVRFGERRGRRFARALAQEHQRNDWTRSALVMKADRTESNEGEDW